MNTIQEAAARVAFAEFEVRRRRQKSDRRASLFRLLATLGFVVLVVGVAVYLQRSHFDISGNAACGIFVSYIVASAARDYRTDERMRELQAQIDALREATRKD